MWWLEGEVIVSSAHRVCRCCHHPLTQTFADLGLSPLSNAYIRPERLQQGEMFYPLHAWVCAHCKLVQLEEFESPKAIFNDEYAYFSSYASSWVAHARDYCQAITAQLGLGPHSQVVEIASNDGYLLQHLVALGIPVLGVEPSRNTATVAQQKGIPTWVRFFGAATAQALCEAGHQADVLIGNNVLAHVPDLHDFVQGLRIALKPCGVITLEFPHVLNLIAQHQFDTIYHEHFSYLSLLVVERLLTQHGLQVFDVQQLPTHGGSLRVFAQHAHGPWATQAGAHAVRHQEAMAGLDNMRTYARFAASVPRVKNELLRFLTAEKEKGLKIACYGAPAKGNTLLNYCGIRSDLIDFTVDLSPHKQGMWLPGSRIPVYAPEHLRATCPDRVWILPWNLKDEIMAQHSYIRDWGGRFVTAIPNIKVWP
jgi:2-polyprenyl-3-methyl-5-hydroxy-6-metoxy-1,4-benzoquinol methylase